MKASPKRYDLLPNKTAGFYILPTEKSGVSLFAQLIEGGKSEGIRDGQYRPELVETSSLVSFPESWHLPGFCHSIFSW